jgi:hypothetical protein
MNGSGGGADQGTGRDRGAGSDRQRNAAPAAVDTLERRYRRWLRVYPERFRQDRGAELLDTLLELSRPGQRRPAPSQVAAVVREGLRARSGVGRPLTRGQVWHAALPLAGILLLVQAAASGLVGAMNVFAARPSGVTYTWALGGEAVTIAWNLLPLLPLAAAWLHRYRVAVALALLSPVVTLAFLITGTSSIPAASVPMALAPDFVPAVLLLPWLFRRPEPGPRRWQVGMPAVCVVLPVLATAAWSSAGMPWVTAFNVPAVAVVLALVALLAWGLLIDARVAMATGVLLVWTALSAAGAAAAHGLVNWLSLIVISALALTVLASGLWTAGRERVR